MEWNGIEWNESNVRVGSTVRYVILEESRISNTVTEATSRQAEVMIIQGGAGRNLEFPNPCRWLLPKDPTVTAATTRILNQRITPSSPTTAVG
jgi:hypothetical protein